MITTQNRAQVGDILLGYSRIIRPVVRVDGWLPIGVALEPLDPAEADAPGWHDVPEYRLTTPGAGASMAVRAVVTGRTPVAWYGDYWVRGRLVVCGDGEPSRSLPCWFLTRWAA